MRSEIGFTEIAHLSLLESTAVAYSIFKDYTFAAAHHIPGHPGKCRHLHGHTYRVRVHLEADQLNEIGMVIDFVELKRVLREVAGPFDHSVINDIPPFDERSPTAELLSEHIFSGVRQRLEDGRVRVRRVEVWESDSSCAIYEP